MEMDYGPGIINFSLHSILLSISFCFFVTLFHEIFQGIQNIGIQSQASKITLKDDEDSCGLQISNISK